MKLKELFNKSYIQDIYDFTCLFLEQGFHAFQINQDNKIRNNDHIKFWNSSSNLAAVKKALNKHISAEDYQIYQTREDLHQLLLIFHIKEAILTNVKNFIKTEDLQEHCNRMSYINVEHSMTTNSTFSEWVNTNEHVQEKSEYFKKMFIKNKPFLSGKKAFLFLVRHNHQNKILYTEDSIQSFLKTLKEKFAFKNILVYPGQCQDILSTLKAKEKQLEIAAKTLDIPNKAIGLNVLNLTLSLDEENYNLSLIFSKVSGYFFYTNNEFNISLLQSNEMNDTIVHEYAHFISSIIYENTQERKPNLFNNLDKWDNDKRNHVKSFHKAHSLKLDWISKTINLSNWETLQKLREEHSKEEGLRYFENNYISEIIKDVIEPSEKLLNAPILFKYETYSGDYQKYHKDILNKISSSVDSKEESIKIPQKNIANALIFFILNSSFAFYPHQIKNKYLKSILHLSVLDSFVAYSSSPEEIWARSFEELVNTGTKSFIDYNGDIAIQDINVHANINETLDKLYKPDFNLIASERLHILNILKYVYSVLLPEITFIPENNKCYKDYILNNPDDSLLDNDYVIKQELFEKAIKCI